MTELYGDEALKIYVAVTPAPVLTDDELNAWGSYYCQESKLHQTYYFDQFIADPRRWCEEVGVFPVPHVGAAPDEQGMKRALLPAQQHVAEMFVSGTP